jgi:hypothetical protein
VGTKLSGYISTPKSLTQRVKGKHCSKLLLALLDPTKWLMISRKETQVPQQKRCGGRLESVGEGALERAGGMRRKG